MCVCYNLDVLIIVHVRISEILHPIFIHIANSFFKKNNISSCFLQNFNSNEVILSELLR